MDKVIFDALVQKGLIAQVGIDYTKYKDAYEMISKGIITYPGARNVVDKLLAKLNVDNSEEPTVIPTETTTVEETKTDETPVETTTTTETETETTTVEETPVKKSSKKSTKKAETTEVAE